MATGLSALGHRGRFTPWRDWRQLGRRGTSGQFRCLFTFESPADCRDAYNVAFAWFRRATPDEQRTLDWKAGGPGLGGHWWRYEVWYFAPFHTDAREGAELLGAELGRLRTLGGAGVQQAVARAAARGGLAVVEEEAAAEWVGLADVVEEPLFEVIATIPAAAAAGLVVAPQAEPNPWAAYFRGPAAAATAREEERGVWL